jgi:hypothetical protein
MPALIFFIILIAVIVAAANWMDAHPGALQLFLFVLYVGGSLIAYRMFSKSRWLSNYKATISRERQERADAKQVKKLRAEQAAFKAEWDAFQRPTASDFLADTPLAPDAPLLTHKAHAVLASRCTAWFDYPPYAMTVQTAQTLYEGLKAATVRGLERYTINLPAIYCRTQTSSPFTTDELATEEEMQSANAALARQFQAFSELSNRANNPLSEPSEPTPPSRSSDDKINKERDREYKAEVKQYERRLKEYQKAETQLWDEQTLTQRTFWNSALYHYADSFLPEPVTNSFNMPVAQRFAGTWIVAPPGRGKTNLLHTLIAEDRKQFCTIVLMDSKGDLINAYRGLPDVVIIEASTVQINPFQLGSSTRTLDFLEYIFSALLETKLTPKQTTLFRCVLALMLRIPNATIETFRRVLVHGWKEYQDAVMELDESNRDFFFVEGRKSEFDGGQYNETKQEVLQRLRLLVSNDYLKQIFTVPHSNINFFELLDSRKTIIIDNSKDELGENGAEFFGRFFVAMVWMAAVSRSRQKQTDKVPVYFYIDECHTVIKRDTKVTTILDECRSQKIALILAHQRITQIEPNVIDALNNCAIRMANSDDDAESLAKRFRVDAPALRLPVGQFACFVRDKTPQAVTINVPLFDTSQFPPPPNPSPEPPRQAAEPLMPAPRIVPTDEVEDF